MGYQIGKAIKDAFNVSQVPIGGYAPVFRSGDAYKAVGEVVLRASYPELSAAFPRNRSFSAVSFTMSNAIWKAIAYGPYGGGGTFVAVASGDSGGTVTDLAAVSRDGKNWLSTKLPAANYWTSLAYGNGLFVAGGGSGAIATSVNGSDWVQRTSGIEAITPNLTITSIIFAAGLFVALCGTNNGSSDSNIALTSPDGITWTQRTMPSSVPWCGIAYGAGKFVAISRGTAAATSPDGINWTARNIPGVTGSSIAYGANAFLVVSSGAGKPHAYSIDGISWTPTVTPGSTLNWNTVIFGDGVFLVTGATGNQMLTSENLLSWIPKVIPASSYAGVYVNGVAIFVGVTTGYACYAENVTDSAYLYLSGTAGQMVRVK